MMETMYWSPTPLVVRRPLLSLDAVKIKLRVNKYDPGWTAKSHHYPKGGAAGRFSALPDQLPKNKARHSPGPPVS